MTASQQAYVAAQYGARAQDYVTSAVHAAGADLDQVEALMRDLPGARVLDLGCGGGHMSYRAAPHVGSVVACDVTPAMLEAVARHAVERGLGNITVQEGAAESLPFPDACFDALLCRFTAHHWADLESGLRQGRRVLKTGAVAVVIDTVAPASPLLDSHLQAVELLRDPSHVRNYTVAEWSAALGRAGFAIEGVTRRQLRMDFPVWIARTRTPPLHADAIRSVQKGAPAGVREAFAIGPDGSFDLETAFFILRAI